MPLYPPASSGGTPGGSNTQVQYNSSSAFAGSAKFTWTDASRIITLGETASDGTIKGADATGANDAGCALILKGGVGGATSGAGGGVQLRGGAGGGDQGGAVELFGGAATASGLPGGGINITTGAGNGAGASGDLFVATADGAASGSAAGFVIFTGGNSNEADAPKIRFTGGSVTGATGNFIGGDIEITPGSGLNSGRAGLVFIYNMPTSDPGVSGALYSVAGAVMISA